MDADHPLNSRATWVMVADSMMERQGVMPKINIHDEPDTFRVEVGWTGWHDDIPGVVQVATTNAHSPFTFPDTDEHTPTLPFHGWHATLDREGINNLIRALRKARDSAYMADA